MQFAIYNNLQAKSTKILQYIYFVNIVNCMNESKEPKNPKNNQSLDKGLYINEDDQDWGSAGMNNVQQEDSE
tara:strand:- start:322 stop:537 length:216 start_codon:yes stop_codon:yes gene_type:complete